jgi:hypothetical protein
MNDDYRSYLEDLKKPPLQNKPIDEFLGRFLKLKISYTLKEKVKKSYSVKVSLEESIKFLKCNYESQGISFPDMVNLVQKMEEFQKICPNGKLSSAFFPKEVETLENYYVICDCGNCEIIIGESRGYYITLKHCTS